MSSFISMRGEIEMNKILLINRTNPKDFSSDKKRICFIVGGMNIPSIENKLIELLNKSGKLEPNDITYKYNGVELNISTQEIPVISKMLLNNNISIYSIFEVYNPQM